MKKLLVDTPAGGQEVVEVGEGGSYFEIARVLWDERVDGTLPEITLGGMVRVGNTLVLDADKLTLAEVVALAPAKIAKNMQINLWRAEANQSTFPYQGKLIACDPLSRSDIDGVANSISLNGSFPLGFPNAWRCTDNTYIPLVNVDAFKAMYSAMTAQGTANFAKAQALKTTLAAATTQAEVDAIVWD